MPTIDDGQLALCLDLPNPWLKEQIEFGIAKLRGQTQRLVRRVFTRRDVMRPIIEKRQLAAIHAGRQRPFVHGLPLRI
jgi:hypothetical protein